MTYTEPVIEELTLKKTLHRHGDYLYININSEEATRLKIKDGDRIRVEKIIETPSTELANQDAGDIDTYD